MNPRIPPCPRCGLSVSVKHGHYLRHDDAQTIPRYRCTGCGKCHSSATHCPTYRQKRRRLNGLIEADLVSSTSQRRIAIKLRCNRKTVARKLKFLAERARVAHEHWIDERAPCGYVQLDELESFEHSRLKPLSVAVLVDAGTRHVLGFGVATKPAAGLMARKACERYGRRLDRSAAMRRKLLGHMKPHLLADVLIETDQHKRYPREIKDCFPEARHQTYQSVRGALTGQGELKRAGYDPLFAINHTLAMFRDDIKRFARRTWCTTKRQDALQDLITVYVVYRNRRLLE